MRLLLLSLYFFVVSEPLFAQAGALTPEKETYFQGSITYTIDAGGPLYAQMEKVYKQNKQMILRIKDADFIVILSNGDFPVTRLFIADSNHTFILDQNNSRYFLYEGSQLKDKKNKNKQKALQSEESESHVPTAEPTQDSLLVCGHMCKAYVIKKPHEKITLYVSPKYKVNTALFKNKTAAQAAFLTKGLQGMIPLKTVRESKDIKTVITATKIEPQELQTGGFRLPPKWKRELYDYRR